MLVTLFTLLIGGAGAHKEEPRLIVGYKDNSPFVFEAQIIDVDVNGNKQYLQKEAAIAYKRMVAAAFQEGITLEVNYGFRSYAEQKKLHRQRRKLAAPPGKSPHQEGIAVDINHSKRRSPVYRWLIKHASQFGFYNTISYEPWHFEYKGNKNAEFNQV